MSTASDTRPDTTRVFISYRREDSAGSTGRLYDSLVERLGKGSEIFLDVDSIDAGVDFVDRVSDAVAGCDVAVVVIGREWLNARTPDGSRRLDDPSDFVRLEVEAALNAGVRVLPVLVDGGVMPHADDLPVSLQPFVRREALELSHNRWRYDVDRLVQSIRATPSTHRTSHRKLAWILSSAVVLAAAIAAVLVLSGGDSEQPPSRGGGTPKILFADTLIDTAYPWPSSEGRCVHRETTSGFEILVPDNEQYSFCAADTSFETALASLGDTRVEVAAQLSTPGGEPPTGDAGVQCRVKGDTRSGSSYAASISPTGAYQLDRYNNGVQKILVNSAYPAGALSTTTVRTLSLRCVDVGKAVRLTFSIDNHNVVTYNDDAIDRLEHGAAGMDVANFTTSAFGVTFTNFVVYGPTSNKSVGTPTTSLRGESVLD